MFTKNTLHKNTIGRCKYESLVKSKLPFFQGTQDRLVVQLGQWPEDQLPEIKLLMVHWFLASRIQNAIHALFSPIFFPFFLPSIKSIPLLPWLILLLPHRQDDKFPVLSYWTAGCCNYCRNHLRVPFQTKRKFAAMQSHLIYNDNLGEKYTSRRCSYYYLLFELDENHVFIGSIVFDDLHAFNPCLTSRYEFQEISWCHASRHSQHADHLTSTDFLREGSLLTGIEQSPR